MAQEKRRRMQNRRGGTGKRRRGEGFSFFALQVIFFAPTPQRPLA